MELKQLSFVCCWRELRVRAYQRKGARIFAYRIVDMRWSGKITTTKTSSDKVNARKRDASLASEPNKWKTKSRCRRTTRWRCCNFVYSHSFKFNFVFFFACFHRFGVCVCDGRVASQVLFLNFLLCTSQSHQSFITGCFFLSLSRFFLILRSFMCANELKHGRAGCFFFYFFFLKIFSLLVLDVRW